MTGLRIALLLLVMVVVHCGLFAYLDNEYNFVRDFYKNMMPEFIIAGEKIVKSKLIVIGFL
jgi:hypothetical protein